MTVHIKNREYPCRMRNQCMDSDRIKISSFLTQSRTFFHQQREHQNKWIGQRREIMEKHQNI